MGGGHPTLLLEPAPFNKHSLVSVSLGSSDRRGREVIIGLLLTVNTKVGVNSQRKRHICAYFFL